MKSVMIRGSGDLTTEIPQLIQHNDDPNFVVLLVSKSNANMGSDRVSVGRGTIVHTGGKPIGTLCLGARLNHIDLRNWHTYTGDILLKGKDNA